MDVEGFVKIHCQGLPGQQMRQLQNQHNVLENQNGQQNNNTAVRKHINFKPDKLAAEIAKRHRKRRYTDYKSMKTI